MTSSSNETLERIARRVPIPEPAYERMLRRRDRKRRNQRIAAGSVGIAVFVAAVLVVTGVGSPDRTQTRVVPGGASTQAPMQAVGPVPQTDYLLDLDAGEMTPLPESIGGSPHAWGYAASPDGSRLAYADRGDNGKSQIFIANLDGTGIEQVTHDLEFAYEPAWSPDGSKIAYIGDQDDRLREVFVLDLVTGESTQLTFANHEPDPAAPDLRRWVAGSPSFTPDGSSIVYGRSDSNLANAEFEMRIVPVAGGESVRLMDGVFEATLSPDGSLLAYAWSTLAGYCVCVSNADGTGERVLVQAANAMSSPRWSPDGTRIAYWGFGQSDVSIVDVVTGQATHVAEGSFPTWLDDHTLIIEMDD